MDGSVRGEVPMSTLDGKDMTTGNGLAPAVGEMENSIPVDGKIELTVTLPGGKEVSPTVDGSLAMIDLLVHIAAKNRISPGSHEIKVPSPYPGEDPIKYKPNTQVKDLGVRILEIVPKKAPESKVPQRKSAKFEQTVRLTVRLSKNKKFVIRVNPDKALCELLPQICAEQGVDPLHCTLRLVDKPEEDIDLFKSLNAYNLPENELILLDLRAPVPKMPVKEEKTKEKKKKSSMFGFRSSLKKKHKGESDTESVKAEPVRPPPPSSIATASVKSTSPSPVRPPPPSSIATASVKSTSPAPSPRPSPPPVGAVALPVIDGSLLRKQQQKQQSPLQQQSAAAPPQPPLRKRQAPRPPAPPPRSKGHIIVTEAKIETPESPQPTMQPAAAVESEIKAVHIETVQQSPRSVESNQSNHSSPLGDRIVIGQEAQVALLDSNSKTVSVSPQSSPTTTTTITTTPTSIHSTTEPSSGTLKKRKAPPPPKPPGPILKSTPPGSTKGSLEKKKAPLQPMPRVRRTSTGSTVSVGSDSSGANMIDSSPAATPPTTLDRPPKHSPSGSPSTRPKDTPPPPPGLGNSEDNDDHSFTSEGQVRKRPPKPPRPQSYPGEVLAGSTRTRRPCSFIAPPPPEEPPSPETQPEDIDKLIQEGRIAIATTQRRNSVTDLPTTEDSYTASDRSTPVSSGHSASERSSIRGDDDDREMEEENDRSVEAQDSVNDGEEILDMLNDVVKEQEENDALSSPVVEMEVGKITLDTVETSVDVTMMEKSTEEVEKVTKSVKTVQSDDDIELTEEEAKILAELEAEAEAEAEEEKEAKEGESSATESEEIALKEERSHILNQVMKLSLDNENSNDTVNYSPTSAPEQEMLEEKLISQLAYPIVRPSTTHVSYTKTSVSHEANVNKEISSPEAEATESQQDEEKGKEIDNVDKVDTAKEENKLIEDKKTIVVNMDITSVNQFVKEDSIEKEEVILESSAIKMDIGGETTVVTADEKIGEKTHEETEGVGKMETKDVQHEKVNVESVKEVSVEHQTPQKESAIPGSETTPPTAAMENATTPEAKQLQEQYALLQQQFAALQQQMISNQQVVLQQQQQQIAAAVSAPGPSMPIPASTTMTNPMMMSQPPMMMPPALTPQMQQQWLMQQQMMMQYQMGMPQPYMMPTQMMSVPPQVPSAVPLSPPQVAQSAAVAVPLQTVATPPQPVASPPQPVASPPQPVVSPPQPIASPPQHVVQSQPELSTSDPPTTVLGSSPPKPTPEPEIPVASPPHVTEFEPEVVFQQEPKAKNTPFGIPLDSRGNISKKSFTVHSSGQEDPDISSTWLGTRHRSTSHPTDPDHLEHNKTGRPRAGTLEVAVPKNKKIPTFPLHEPEKVDPVPHHEPKNIVIIDASKPKEEEKSKQEEVVEKPKKETVIASPPPQVHPIVKPKETKPTRGIVILESTPRPVDISKPKEEKPKKDIVIIENTPKPSNTVPVVSHTEEATASTAAAAGTGRQGYGHGIPKGRQSHKGGSEVQIRHLHSAREDELSATRESASVSRLRAMFGGADKS